MKLLLCYGAEVNIMADWLTHKAAWVNSIHNNLQCSETSESKTSAALKPHSFLLLGVHVSQGPDTVMTETVPD